ncbi:MAG TPA: acyl-CoA dehydrogenase family protein [Spirochaetia bacterium]|nr:acyl-CoA dehydrogenase family protein [Spirochaetia bacterium]
MIEFTEEQSLVLETAREFNEKAAMKFVEEMDRENRFPEPLPAKLAGSGLLGMKLPEQYGGGGIDALGSVLVIEELARVSPAIADFLVSVHASTGVILSFASEELKLKYLPQVAEGKLIPAYALTEADAGSDLSAIRSTATKKGDGYILNGSKTFITLGAVADLAVVLAITDPKAEKKHRGMTLLLAEGFTRGKEEDLMGLRGLAVGEVSFVDTTVPAENVIGEENSGFSQIMKSLDGGRIEVAALSVGLAQGALDEAVRYAKQRVQFGKPISDFQAIQFMIADMQTKIDAARCITYHAAQLKDAGKSYSREASEAKLFASEIAMQCASDSLQIHGGYGYSKEYPIERLFRDAKINQIFEGTNQIQKLVIARSLLGR